MNGNEIAEPASPEKLALAEIRAAKRRSFLETCEPSTVRIHRPIVNTDDVEGCLNPNGLGNARKFSRMGNFGHNSGQSSVVFDSVEAYHEATQPGHFSAYGAAEYGITLTPAAAALSEKIANLHGGVGAIICPSGLSAITTTINAFLKTNDSKPKVALLPENVFFPAPRYLREEKKLEPIFYPGAASAAEVASILDGILATHDPADVMLWLEAPGNATFEIPDIKGIADLARDRGVRSVMDNSWASHVRFRPLDYGIDIAIQSLTKSEAGYGDTPSGAVIAGNVEDLVRLQRTLKISGNGAVAQEICRRVFNRIDSTKKRLDRHYATALKLMDWFSRQEGFVDRILCPALENSPDHERFKQYFGEGNGLFSIVFKDDIPAAKIKNFMNGLALFRIAEGWGSHVSLVMLLNPNERKFSSWPKGAVMRFHAGLENAQDLLRDLEQAGSRAFGPVVGARELMRGRDEPNPGQRHEI